MYLKALEIQGFKSFPEKTLITFGEELTAIVGPNGSGKSNLSDAIRWVMGEQSTKALRGGKMEDIIFGGTQTRKQQGFAEVSLVLDNTARRIDREESELMVTRRYYRSGESEYYINRHAVRLKDVNELFMDTGLGREGYSIIGQGKIDEILSVKSADRREIFEEAAGISRYRHRKEEAERRLERTEENLVRVSDKISELELQVEPLRHQAEKAKRYLILRDELRLLEISVWMDQLDQIRANTVRLNSDYDGAVRRKTQTQQEVEALYRDAEAYTVQMREKDTAAERIRFEMMQRQADANELENTAAVYRANLQNNLENKIRVQQELDRQTGRAGSLEAQMQQQRGRLEALLCEIQTRTQCRAEKENQARQAARSAEAVLGEIDALRTKETLETASAAEAKALLSALAAAAQEVLDRDAALRQTLLEEERQREVQEEDRAAAQAALKDAKAQRVALGNTVSGYALRLEQRRQRVQAGTDRHIKLQMEEHALQSRLQMLSEMETLYEGYSKAVKLVMGEAKRGRLKGICGPVAGLIQVPDAYAVAIETALGGAMQHIVVEQEEDGKAAIESLKRREGGRGTFLPLSAIRPAEFQFGAVTQEPGFVGLGDGLVQCERKYQAVISHLLGRVVVAEDLDRAIAMTRKYHHRLKIVTLDGQVLNPGGSMTGGSASRSAGILSRANELARLKIQLETVREDLAKAAQAKETAQREETAAAYELETAQERLRTQENQILQIETRQTALNQQITDLQTRQTAQRAELKQMEARSAQIEQETAQVRTRIETLEGAAAALRAESEAKARGRGALQEKLEAVQAEIALENVALAALEAERTTLEQALRELEDLKREMTGDRAQQEKLLAELDEHNETLSAQILEQEQLLQTIQAENSGRQAAIDRLKEERLALEAKRTQTDKASRTQNNALLELERTVSVLEQKKAAAGMEEQQILEKLWETYELSHAGASAQRITLESVPKAVRRIAELKKSISALGNINLDAIEEFQRINERYTYLIGQRDDVAKAQKSLKDIIADITSEMRRIFSEQFTVINQAFGETFSALFGGGKAALELEDPDDILGCGIEIRVQPPGKALKILSLLSGGEKAFVAIALYFAILKVRPTPFCVMDEIEAALDDANVERFARYLRQMCRQTQFIVITHRRGTMEEADVLYGVTMQEQGVSRLLTINLNDVERELHLDTK